MQSKQTLKQLNPYQQGMQIADVKKKYNLDRIVKLSSNENPFGCSPKVSAYLAESTHDLAEYPDGHSSKLRKQLGQKLEVSEEQLVFGSGSDELVQIISRVYLTNESEIITAFPTFPQYKHHAIIEGAKVTEIPNRSDGGHDLEKMLASITSKTKIVWLCTPNNPTGVIIEKNELDNFIENCPKDILIILDEAYIEFVQESKRIHTEHYPDKHKNIIVLRTFSKAYGLAGLRIGYGIGRQEVMEHINIVRGPFNTSSIAQNAASIALEDHEYLEKITRNNQQIRKDFVTKLNQLGWMCYESETNFVLVKTPFCDLEVFEFLLKNGFIVRPGTRLGQPGTIRITIGSARDMKELVEVISQLTESK